MSNQPALLRHDVAWLPIVRWATCLVLWSVVLAAWLLPQIDLSLRGIAPLALAAAICRTVVSALGQWRRHAPPVATGLSWCADAILLTGLLDITGGPFNPFIVMFVPYVWLAAVTLSPRWAAVVAVISVTGFGWLVLDHVQPQLAQHHRLNDFPTHLFTMWLSGAAIAELIAHYVGKARAAVALHQRQLDEARERALHSEHLASLTTLAAGAAHELSTPLATIAVAARELERHAARLAAERPAASGLQDDARLIRAEVDRCQLILDGMSGRAVAGSGPAADPLPPAEIADLVRARLSDDQRGRLRVAIVPGVGMTNAPGAAVAQAVTSLLRNAFDASDPAAEVNMTFEQQDGMVRVLVHDRGPGMPPEVLRRVGEPFYTTKQAGKGMGLGLFLTRTFADRAGGTLRFETRDGTTAVLEIPAVGTTVALA
jgi:two-component system sensor histidine kinase RegB